MGSGFFWIALSLHGPVQLTLGALALVPIVLIRRLPRPRSWTIWGHLTVSALIANAIPYTLFGIAQQTVPSSLAGVINATTPLWTVLIATAARTEGPLTPRRALGVGLGFVGVLVLFEPWNAATGAQIGGVLACIGAAASYGLAYVYQGKFLTNRGLSPITLTTAQLVVASAILAAALPFGGGTTAQPLAIAVVAILVLGVIGTGVALIINFTLIASEGATAASVVTYLVPVVAVALGVLVLHEPAQLTLPIGAILILTGVASVRRARTIRQVARHRQTRSSSTFTTSPTTATRARPPAGAIVTVTPVGVDNSGGRPRMGASPAASQRRTGRGSRSPGSGRSSWPSVMRTDECPSGPRQGVPAGSWMLTTAVAEVGSTSWTRSTRRATRLHPERWCPWTRDQRHSKGMVSPLLEREWHLDALGKWARESRVEGRLVLVSGEAGIGKSSLVRAFTATSGRGMRRLWGACEPLTTPRPLAPLLDIAAAEPALAALLATGAEPLELFHALYRSLQGRQVTLLVLEDVHWADDATLDLLGFICRRIAEVPALVIVTHRDDELGPGHPLRVRLGELATLPAIRRLPVTALSRAAVDRLAAGSDLDVDELWRCTAGNPFFVTEVLAADGTTVVPSSAADAVLARAARLPRLARDVLDVVAVLDTEAKATAVEAIVGPAEEGLDHCVGGGLLVPAPGGVSFRHELARMAIYAALPPGRRTRLHGAVLHALEALGVEPALLAHHAELAGDLTRTRRWAERAAEDAARAGAHRQAADHYARVLRALPAAARRERAALLLRCSRACASSDRIGEATTEAEAALQLWRAEGDRLREADTLSRLAMLAWTSDRIGAAVDLGRAAADLLARLPPSMELARALAIVARLLANHYAHPDATSWARRALALADELGEHRVAAHAAVDLGMVLAARGFPSGRGLVEQAVIRARALGADDEAAYGMFTLARLASAASDHDGLQAAVAAARSFCFERGIEIWADYIQMIEAQDLLHRGEWAEADTLARELWRRTTPTSPASRVAVACTTLGLVRLRRGEPDPDTLLEVAAGRLANAPVTNPVLELASARAEAAWYAGGPRTVEAEVRALWDVARQREGWWVDELRWWLTVADGPAATAREWRAAAQRWAERGHPYHRALALSASAEEAALREALSIAHDLGARPLAARVARSLRALGVRRVPRVPAPAATLSGPLSAREHEVLALLAEGLRDAEIAARLHLSPRTVNHHVSAVLQKLAARSRTAAVRRAVREGMLTSE